MREILFRGKSAVKGEWIEGYYFKARIGGKAIHCILPYGDFVERVMGLREGRIYQVIPETVGQFTGLTDKNGTKIFEGDIVRLCHVEGKKRFWELLNTDNTMMMKPKKENITIWGSILTYLNTVYRY